MTNTVQSHVERNEDSGSLYKVNISEAIGSSVQNSSASCINVKYVGCSNILTMLATLILAGTTS